MTYAFMPAGRALPLPGFSPSRAPWPVWSGSAKKPVRWSPVAKKTAVRLYHAARRFERQTRSYGRQDGALGRNGLAVLHALLFDFLNFRTGRLDPSAKAIAAAANISIRSVWRGIAALKAAGVLHSVRRCAEVVTEDGRFELRQESNAYAVREAKHWQGYDVPPEPPAPEPDTWGATPPLPDAITVACAEKGAAMIAALASDPADKLAAMLARLGAGIAAKTLGLSVCQPDRETQPHILTNRRSLSLRRS